mmetsp:Transcript_20134/g.42149  ORF Transcript_20134/g.42149 Transcript_20134/m.42149 type:complete len:131 (+) Transcript_20134:47-439(+)
MMMQPGMDPMSGLGGQNNTNEQSTSGEGRSIYNAQVAQKNALVMSDARTFMSIISGIISGISGATGLTGLSIFLSLHMLTGLGLLVVLNFDVKSYTGNNSLVSFLTQDLQKCGLSFVLFWTLFYGVVYLF